MSTTRRLWFHIEEVFTDIRRLCREARAAELRAHAREEQRDWIPGRSSVTRPSTAFDDQTEEVPVMGEALGAPEPFVRSRAPAGGAASAGPGGTEAPPTAGGGADIVALRAEIRRRLGSLKQKLGETLTEREVYYVLFPIVIYTDELVQSALETRAGIWRPFQMELYEIDNGGEVFYALIETLLKKEETLPLIYEVFYFCLQDGFFGQYQSDRAKIDEYKARLAFRIPVEKPEAMQAELRGEEDAVQLIEFPKWYYVGAAAAVIGFFILLHLVSHFQA